MVHKKSQQQQQLSYIIDLANICPREVKNVVKWRDENFAFPKSPSRIWTSQTVPRELAPMSIITRTKK